MRGKPLRKTKSGWIIPWWMFIIVSLLMSACLVTTTASIYKPGKKAALFITNTSYENHPVRTSNRPVHLIANTLSGRDFKIFKENNLTLDETNRAVDRFIDTVYSTRYIYSPSKEDIRRRRAENGGENDNREKNPYGAEYLDILFFYYKGHIVQWEGANYLIPLKAKINNEEQLQTSAVNLYDLIFKLRLVDAKLLVIALDVSYENQIVLSSMDKKQGSAPLTPLSRTIIAYSNRPDSLPPEQIQEKNLFSSVLYRSLKQHDLVDMKLFSKLKSEVFETSQGQQVPWVTVAPDSPVYFSPAKTGNRQQTAPTPKTITDSVTGMEMVLVQGGCFWMGDYFLLGSDDERPIHEVCVDDFYLGKYEITQTEWLDIMSENPSEFKAGDTYPVENVDFNMAVDYISRLNDISGEDYRLPTEAEWEYVCKEGLRNNIYSWGNPHPLLLSEDVANIWDSDYTLGLRTLEFRQPYEDGFLYSSRVGRFPPNSFGIFDLSGNVAEWTSDRFDASYYKRSPKHNPLGPSNGTARVVKGGAWSDGTGNVRCSYRNWYTPSVRNNRTGFRIAKSADSRTDTVDENKSISENLIDETGHFIPDMNRWNVVTDYEITIFDEFGSPFPNIKYTLEFWDGTQTVGQNTPEGLTDLHHIKLGKYLIEYHRDENNFAPGSGFFELILDGKKGVFKEIYR